MAVSPLVLAVGGIGLFLLLAWFLVHGAPSDPRGEDPFFGDRDDDRRR
ncbi:MAG: hypothetical protein H6923_03820 [Alphaproteobacteria bacterium]|nr:hypothetical protein [Alphaproteobacteria bacterium]